MTKQSSKYLLNLVMSDLKGLEKSMIKYQELEKKESQYSSFWSERIKATKNKIDLARKTLNILSAEKALTKN